MKGDDSRTKTNSRTKYCKATLWWPEPHAALAAALPSLSARPGPQSTAPAVVRERFTKKFQEAPATPGLREAIEETAELVTAAGGHGIAVRVDHESPAEVKKLAARIKRQHKGLDILVNHVWGGDALTEWSKPFWTVGPRPRIRIHRPRRYPAPLG